MTISLTPVILGDDETVVHVLDLGGNFRGLADSVLMPTEAFEAHLADLEPIEGLTIARDGESVEIFDPNSGVTTTYVPQTIASVTGYVVTGAGFRYAEEN